MLLRMMASPLPETRDFAAMMLAELKKVIPSFVARVERPDRGGEWIDYLRERREATERWVARLGLDRRSGPDRPSVELVHVDGSEEDLLASSLFEQAGAPEEEIRVRIDALDGNERERALRRRWPASARNRRHRPGRGWEAIRYRFEIVSDYGGFRDLQRHRMLTCQWQRLSPDLGAGIPEEVARGRASATTTSARSRSRARSSTASRPPGSPTRRRTRSASATASATSSTSTRARRCTSASCARAARAIPPTARSRRRCTSRSPRCTRASPRR